MRGVIAIGLLMGCSAPAIEIAPPPPTHGTATLVVETWDLFLFYANEPTRAQRLQNVVKSLAATEGVDVTCLRSLSDDVDRASIIEGVKATFPHHAYVETSRNTPFDDPRDLTGVVREPPSTPPCRSSADIAALEGHVKCVLDCRGVDGALDEACATLCGEPPVTEDPRCSLCMKTALTFSPLAEAVATCRDTPRGELAANGRFDIVILSRRKLIGAPRAVVFPSTMARQGAIVTSVEVEGRTVNVMCSTFPGNFAGPYAGVFAAPGSPQEGDFYEFNLNKLRTIELAHKLGAERTTIMLGGGFPMWEVHRTTRVPRIYEWNTFATNFQPLLFPGDVCTGCRANKLLVKFLRSVPDVYDYLAFVAGPPVVVESTEIARTEEAFEVDRAVYAASPFYSLRTRVVLP